MYSIQLELPTVLTSFHILISIIVIFLNAKCTNLANNFRLTVGCNSTRNYCFRFLFISMFSLSIFFVIEKKLNLNITQNNVFFIQIVLKKRFFFFLYLIFSWKHNNKLKYFPNIVKKYINVCVSFAKKIFMQKK